MYKYYKLFWAIGLVMTLLMCCTNDADEPKPIMDVPVVNLTTRSEDVTQRIGTTVGIYMMYGDMLASGNYEDNLMLKYTAMNTWIAEHELYWKNKEDHAYFVGYVPYDISMADALAYTFHVNADQSSEDARQACDFQWGKLADQAPTEDEMILSLHHLFSLVSIKIVAGEGISESELKDGTLNVTLNGTRTQAILNLAEGTSSAIGGVQSISPYRESMLAYSAVVVPQRVAETDLIVVSWKGTDYKFKGQITYKPSKQYKFTATLNKIHEGINVSIDDWDVIDEDFGGSAE